MNICSYVNLSTFYRNCQESAIKQENLKYYSPDSSLLWSKRPRLPLLFHFSRKHKKEAIAPANHLLSENNLLEQWLLLY